MQCNVSALGLDSFSYSEDLRSCIVRAGAPQILKCLRVLLQLLQKLQQKRTALEKELSKVPGAPTSKKDVFHLCRGFERAFTHLLEAHPPAPSIHCLS